MAGLNNSGGLWAVDVVPSCLVPGLWVIKAEEYCRLGGTVQAKGVWLWMGEFYITGLLPDGPFVVSKEWLIQEG